MQQFQRMNLERDVVLEETAKHMMIQIGGFQALSESVYQHHPYGKIGIGY